jgi:hypothetical protein
MRISWMGLGGGAVCVALLACGAADETAGRLLEDAGELLADAGTAIADAGNAMADAGTGASGHADAQAVPVGPRSETFEVQCVDKYVQTMTNNATGLVRRTVVRVAEVPTSTANVSGIDSIVCGREASPPASACPSGFTCTGAVPPGPGSCGTSYVTSMEPNVIRIFCGTFSEVNGVLEANYQRWATARVTVRR